MNLDDAMEFAAKAHRGQVRDGEAPLPYITHPVEVLINLRYVGGIENPDMQTAALLHDVVEESGTTFEEIEKQFGPRVRDLVKELTREEPTSEQTAGMSKDEIWELRSGMLLGEISQMSPTAQTIKLADRFSNLREAHQVKSGKKLKRYAKQSEKILEIIPKATNPGLWMAIRQLLDG
ncbi:MAG: hypothetical protein BGO01_06440 [Armatimonadetes bacterium 55-13]|nr:MAG: hypothetical protein BGO01_06440 [Armatimonadetes bacterium 55-13]